MESDDSPVKVVHTSVPSAVTLRLRRPQTRNALRPDDLRRLNAYLAECQSDPAVKLIFITGSDGAFTSGADINEINRLEGDALAAFIELQAEFLTRIISSPKIVVAAVNGATAGLGNHLAICSDLCFALEGATFNFTGVGKGLPSLLPGTLLLPMTIGLKRAKALYLRGGRVTAEAAVALGFCNEVIPADRWDSTLDALAAEFAERRSSTLAHNKYQLNQAAFQLFGAAKLSALAGSASLSERTDVVTGRLAAGSRA